MTLGAVTIVLKNDNELSVKATEIPEGEIGLDHEWIW